MNYLTRPVFQFPINWIESPARSFSYDLREVSAGFNAEVFTGRGLYVVNGWSFTLELETEAKITAFDDFVDGRGGRLVGFWFPVPMKAFEIVGSLSSTQFTIVDQNLRLSYSDSPDLHLYFDDGITQQAAKITAVIQSGAYERVTVDAPLAGITSDVTAYRLHYVRFADDSESGKFIKEFHQQRGVRVIELPSEYATAETGERPIYLYHIWCAAPVDYHWRYTSFESDVISDSKTHRVFAMNHGNLKSSTQLKNQTCDIESAYEPDHPFSLMLPVPNPKPLNISVERCFYSDPDTVTRLFTGRVRRVRDAGTKLMAECDSFLGRLEQRIPAMLIKPRCSFRVFDVRTCKAVQAVYQTSGFITAIDNDAQPPTVEVELRFEKDTYTSTDWFAQGWIETGMQLDFELRTVFNSTWDSFTSRLTLVLNAPLLRAIVGQEIQLIPGCNGEAATCRDKFNNYQNFPGFIEIPNENPSMKAIENKTSQGNKK